VTSNIDVLIQKLREASLAHELVSLLRETPSERWQAVLKSHLQSRIDRKREGALHAEDQEVRD